MATTVGVNAAVRDPHGNAVSPLLVKFTALLTLDYKPFEFTLKPATGCFNAVRVHSYGGTSLIRNSPSRRTLQYPYA